MAKKTNTQINGKDYFRVTATVGKKSDGTPVRKQFYGSSKKEAENKRDEYLSKINNGFSLDFDKITFIDIFEKWFFETVKNSISISSYTRYNTEYKLRVKTSPFANLKLVDIKPMHIQLYYNELIKKGNTVYTIKFLNVLLTKFFNYCIKSDLIVKSPLNAVEIPIDKTVKNKYKFLSKDDINKFIKAVDNDMDNFIFVFAIFTGIRQGEILALTIKDIDLQNDIIHINKTVNFLNVDGVYKPILSTPKTKSSIREVPILENLKEMLFKYIECAKEKHNKMQIPFNADSILFSSNKCEYSNGVRLSTKLKSFLKVNDIPPITFHALRHTFCSLLAENNVPIKTASVLMGHSNIMMTGNIYTHVTGEQKKESIKTLSTLF